MLELKCLALRLALQLRHDLSVVKCSATGPLLTTLATNMLACVQLYSCSLKLVFTVPAGMYVLLCLYSERLAMIREILDIHSHAHI